jgi:type II secretory pathway pseudopilin PulG
MRVRKAYTLVELLIVIVMVGALTFVAVPRLQFGLKHRQQAEATAWKIVTGLRRTRSLAILHAATKPAGFALKFRSSGSSTICEIVDIASSSVVDSKTVDSTVTCTGGVKFEFGPLGALKPQSDTSLSVSAMGKTLTISIVPATGMVRCVES